MMLLIIGGSGSGKSAYAEERIVQLAENMQKYYLATMQVFDEEGQEKVSRHQKMRQEKGFVTIEQATTIQEAFHQLSEENPKVALLECISNLVANEMFGGGEPVSVEAVVTKVMTGIRQLQEVVQHFVIVTNNVFEDGIDYDETTRSYIRAMGRINESLAIMADEVVEVVVGIPVVIKEVDKKANKRS